MNEVSLFAKDETLLLGHRKVRHAFAIGLQSRAVTFVSGETVERNQSPRDVVGAFVRKEVSDQVTATTRDDAAPVFSVRLESIALERIDLIANDAGDHGFSPALVITVGTQVQFVYHQNVNVEQLDEVAVARIAGAIGEPARARMLFCLMDGHARTSTELAIVADVATSTASAHLNRLKAERLVRVITQGKHRFYSLDGPKVATVLEGLSVLVEQPRPKFVPTTPTRLRSARVCYDHIAGRLGVVLHDRFQQLKWLTDSYDLTAEGVTVLEGLGVDVEEMRRLRRRFAYACLDWSERRPHIAGALGSALLKIALKRKWVAQDLDSRAIRVTNAGRREMLARFGVEIQSN